MYLMEKIHDKKLMATGFSRANMVLLVLKHLLCGTVGLMGLQNYLILQEYKPTHHFFIGMMPHTHPW